MNDTSSDPVTPAQAFALDVSVRLGATRNDGLPLTPEELEKLAIGIPQLKTAMQRAVSEASTLEGAPAGVSFSAHVEETEVAICVLAGRMSATVGLRLTEGEVEPAQAELLLLVDLTTQIGPDKVVPRLFAVDPTCMNEYLRVNWPSEGPVRDLMDATVANGEGVWRWCRNPYARQRIAIVCVPFGAPDLNPEAATQEVPSGE